MPELDYSNSNFVGVAVNWISIKVLFCSHDH